MNHRSSAVLAVLLCIAAPAALAQQSTLRPLDPATANLVNPASRAPAIEPSPRESVQQLQGQLGPQRQAPAPLPATAVLPAGSRLSTALERYVRDRGWALRWNIEEDYVLDVNLPIPTSELIDGVTWVVHAYQSQGGMLGVVPRFARGNNVVVIEKMDVRESY
ncbi:MAG: hypothetical protein A2580_08650 [Hydrogenophilales bacterium RIFOXYD1_FULL_62_11]|nr:MAG: hypothetical protein A2580_08650 [Hydrogenophilales bacterium RIFOXYD1_FULL_62_11]